MSIEPQSLPSSAAGVLLCGMDSDLADELTRRLAPIAVRNAASLEQAVAAFDDPSAAVLCVGDGLTGEAASGFLDLAAGSAGGDRRLNVVLAAGADLEPFQDLVASDQVYYLTSQPPPLDDVERILTSAVAQALRNRQQAFAEPAAEAVDAPAAQAILEISRQLARETTPERITMLTARAILQLVEADRAESLLYDPETDTLWTPRLQEGEERRESAAAGLVSFVLRTGSAVCLERAGSDPRYDPDADTDGEAPELRFLAVPVASGSGEALAVLVALREADQPPFTDRDRERLELLAERITPAYSHLALQVRLDREAARRHGAAATSMGTLFRGEALEHHLGGFHERSSLLRLSPDWIFWSYRLLIVVFVAAFLFAMLASINEYAPGAAVVRVEGRTEINARRAGTVVAVEVEPGQRVVDGQLLVRFYDAQEAAELERIAKDFELGLADHLRNPADRGAERALSALRTQKEHAEARLEELSVQAPHAGKVGDIRVRSGQHILPGQGILSLIGESTQPAVISLFPGHFRPLIEPGMPLRLELEGYQYAYQQLVVDAVDEEVVGPAEARRRLGAGIGDALVLAGPVVFVYARLPSETFTSRGQTFEYHDGMQGLAEVRVRRESMLETLIPGLKAWFDQGGEP